LPRLEAAALASNFSDLEEAVSGGVDVSREMLARYKAQAAEIGDHLGEMWRLHSQAAVVAPA